MAQDPTHATPSPTSPASELIVSIYDRFEAGWDAGETPSLADHVKMLGLSANAGAQRGLLIKLIFIDLEKCWRRENERVTSIKDIAATTDYGPSDADRGADLPTQPMLDDYVANFPVLGPVQELPTELIVQEYRARLRWGDQPGYEDYRERFPDRWLELQPIFEQMDSELDNRDAVHSGYDTGQQFQAEGDGNRGVGVDGSDQAEARCSDVSERSDDHAGVSRDLPRRIGRYVVKQLLGEGAFGRVYLGDDPELERLVAVKVPHPERMADAVDAEVYVTEARMVAALDHPAIVPVYDAGRTDDQLCYVVSKYIEGGNLAHLLQRGPPSHTKITELVAVLAEALDHTHRRGLIHRDIKPANILIDETGRPYLVDFGLALKEEGYGKGARFAGTPCYMSPEQACGEGHLVDGRSDIFSLGVVFYELLTGVPPFRGNDSSEVLGLIQTTDPVPPSQVKKTVPEELERICLKALSKRASDRFVSALEMAEDLWHFLAGEKIEEPSKGPAPIVPRGLRSFDAEDADFFLELLPGPRDRDGLPESIRFWKTRIAQTDAEQTFRVGVIYGPSGCGKSSLVRAGLLPRLDGHVTPVYVEATADDTELRLMRGLRRACPDLPRDLGLTSLLAALRRGRGITAGHKVVLVVDQFEQWLNAHGTEETSGLMTALRQCDGEQLQCVLMIRDDFWMAATRFMRQLDIPVVEGHNFAAVDLFDPAHARKVLAKFGRAYGQLPENLGELTDDQEAFIDRAVDELAEDNKVVCVRLALFADLFKGKSWDVAGLRQVGGAEGLGEVFLDETFSAASAPAAHRYHQKATQAVLKALLPQAGTSIKGCMRSCAELMAAAGYEHRVKDLDDLLRVLDGELRLITPTDPAGSSAEEPSQPPGHARHEYYQLTHDYLVSSLRLWLTRRQKETRRGRAELRLEERTELWKAKPQKKQLPGLWEYLNIGLLTSRRRWTVPQRAMMQSAGRYHVFRTGIALALVLVSYVVAAVLRERLEVQRERLVASELVDRLLVAEIEHVPVIVVELEGYRYWANPLLEDRLVSAEITPPKRLRTLLGLLPANAKYAKDLREQLLEAKPNELPVIRDEFRDALEPYGDRFKDELVTPLWDVLSNDNQDVRRRFRAGCALATYDPPADPPTAKWQTSSALIAEQLVAEIVRDPSYYPPLLKALRPVRDPLLEPLASIFRDAERVGGQRAIATNLLAEYAVDKPVVLCELLCDAKPEQFDLLYPIVERDHRDRAINLFEKQVSHAPAPDAPTVEKEAQASRQANAAVALLRLRKTEQVWPLLRLSVDPTARSYFLQRLAPLGARPDELVSRLERESDVSVRRVPILSLGEFRPDTLSLSDRDALTPKLLAMYEKDPDPGIHGAAEWLLRKWGLQGELNEIDRNLATGKPEGDRHWYLTCNGQPMFIYDPEENGNANGRLRHRSAIATKEVTVAQFKEFDAFFVSALDEEFFREHPKSDCPMGAVSWYRAAHYCNWLSFEEGIPEDQWCYLPKYDDKSKKGKYEEGMQTAPDFLSRIGYRLPTEAEWEIVCLAGTKTSRYYGSPDSLLGRYAWYRTNSEEKTWPVGSLRPNDWGLFDMHGNVWNWLHDRRGSFANPEDDTQLVKNTDFRVLRGGSFLNDAQAVHSPEGLPPLHTYSHHGFRVARTLPREVVPAPPGGGGSPKFGTHPILGARLEAVPEGVVIRAILPGAPADAGGLQAGDIILEFSGRSIRNTQDLSEIVRNSEPDSVHKVKFVRDGKHEEVDVTLQLHPVNRARNLAARGRELYLNRRYEEAITALEAAVKAWQVLVNAGLKGADRELAYVYLELGKSRVEVDQIQQAVTEYEEAIPIFERLAGVPSVRQTEDRLGLGWACCDMADAWRELGETDKALQWYARAINVLEQMPADAPRHKVTAKEILRDAFCRCAQTHEKLRQYVEAVDYYGRAIDLEIPNDFGPLLARGDAYATFEQWEKAAADFQECDESCFPAWPARATMALRAEDKEQYRRICGEMTDLFGQDDKPSIKRRILRTCALAPRAVSDLERCVRRAKQMADDSPKDASLQETLGAIRHRAGDYPGAQEALLKSVELHGGGGSIKSCLFLAITHQKLGEPDTAKEWLEKAVKRIDDQKQSAEELPWETLVEQRVLRAEAELQVLDEAR